MFSTETGRQLHIPVALHYDLAELVRSDWLAVGVELLPELQPGFGCPAIDDCYVGYLDLFLWTAPPLLSLLDNECTSF